MSSLAIIKFARQTETTLGMSVIARVKQKQSPEESTAYVLRAFLLGTQTKEK